MEVHVVITEKDLDEKTVNIVEQKVVAKQTEDTNTVQFTKQLKEVDASTISHFVVSEINQDKNPSNKIVALTGWKIFGQWYGDSPDNSNYIDPFTGEVIIKGEYTPPAPESSRSIIRVTEQYEGHVIEFLNITNDLDYTIFESVGNFFADDGLAPEVTDNGDSKSYKFISRQASIARTNAFKLRFRDTEKNRYIYQMNRTKFDGDLSVYEYDLGEAPATLVGTPIPEREDPYALSY